MSITIKKDAWRIKDDNGVYRSADLFSTMLPSEAQQLVEETRTEFTDMENKAGEVLENLANAKQEILDLEVQTKQEIEATGTEQKGEITTHTEKKKQEVTSEGAAQVTAVNAKGQEVLASIPNDYTKLVNTVKTMAYGGFIYNTNSGVAASFDDGADGMLIKSLIANIEPQQDLHGYDRLWVGGNGKNLLPNKGTYTDGGVTFSVNSDGSVKIVGTATATTGYNFYGGANEKYIPTGSYRLILTGSGTGFNNITLQAFRNGASAISTKDGTFTVQESDTTSYARLRVPSGTTCDCTVYPMMMLSNETDTSWAPYENICQFIGWTELNGTRTGKNLLPTRDSYTSGGITFSFNSDGSVKIVGTATATVGYNFYNTVHEKSIPTGSYRLILTGSGTGFDAITLQVNLSGSTAITTQDGTFTVQESDTTSYARLRVPSGTTCDCTVYPMMMLSSVSDTTWEPYKSDIIFVNWQDSVGTVHAGYIDVISGKLFITEETLVCDGTETYWTCVGSTGSTLRYYFNWSSIDKTIDSTNVACSHLSRLSGNIGTFGTFDASNELFMVHDKDARSANVTEFKAWLADEYTNGTPFTIRYKLSEPREVQLAPQQITCLAGVNNIQVDTGDVTVTYPVDTKTYIDRKIQEAIDGLSGS